MAASSGGVGGAAQAQEYPRVDERELCFLILHHLASGPYDRAFQALQQDAAANSLLPTRTDILGTEHPMSYEELRREYCHMSPGLLPQLLAHALQAQRARSQLLQGLDSLLGAGIASLTQPADGDPKCQPAKPASLVSKVASRAWSHGPRTAVALRRTAPQLMASRMQHQKTIRGHRYPVYCLTFDRTGRLLISGSDDRNVKMWSMQTGLLRMTCRGHEGEVTDLVVSADNAMAASSSNDASIRVWSLQEGALGQAVSVLLGHGGPITFVDFHRHIPEVLLSSSVDGSCRLWDARAGGAALHQLNAGPQFRLAPIAPHAASAVETDPVAPGSSGPAADADPPPAAEAGTQAADAADNEHVQLLVCSFSPDGTQIAAGATDCHCYVWDWDVFPQQPQPATAPHSRASATPAVDAASLGETAAPRELARLQGHKNDVLLLQFSADSKALATGSRDGSLRVWRRQRGGPAQAAWQCALTLCAPVDEEAVAQARRRRRAPPTPAINQLAWTKDDVQVLASVTDNSIIVWDAHSGRQAARLVGHESNVHVLEGHPTHFHVAMSASYDGRTIVWDLRTGAQLASFSTKDTRPNGGTWADPLHLMDGHWTSDGLGLVVSDSAGQLHFYGTGNADMYARARYDQFTDGETRPLTQDLAGFVIDTERQLPPHLCFASDKLGDYMGEPYPPAYQTAWHSGRLWQLSIAEAQANPDGSPHSHVPPAVHQFPPVISAAGWAAQESGGGEAAIQSAVARAVERMQQADLAAAELQLPPVAEEEAVEPPPQAAPTAVATDQQEAAPRAPALRGVSTRRTRRSDDDDRDYTQAAHDSDSSSMSGMFDDDFAEVYGVENVSRAERLAMRTRRREELLEGQRQSRRRRRQGAQRPAQQPEERPDRRKRRRTSRFADEEDVDVDTDDLGLETDEDDVGDEEAGPSKRPRRAVARSDGEYRGQSQSERSQRREAARRRAGPGTVPRLSASASSGGRLAKAYAWLQDCKHRPGVYVPQLGDDVVYIWEGHQQYLQTTNDKARGPWTTVTFTDEEGNVHSMRMAEPAKVVGLRYTIGDGGQADTFATVRLSIDDQFSPLCGREFEVDIPPSHLGQAEFVIARSRFEGSLALSLRPGERCKIFYADEGERGQWWRGTIIGDDLHNLQPEWVQDQLFDPWESALWERFTVIWDRQAGECEAGIESPERMVTHHAAWEMFDEADTEADTLAGGPELDAAIAARAASALEACLQNPEYSLFAAAPEPDERFPTSDGGGMLFYNQIVELPMSLLIIQARLQHRYYRQADALKHDAQLLASNAVAFNGRGSSIARLAQRLADKIVAAAEDREPPPSDEDDAGDLLGSQGLDATQAARTAGGGGGGRARRKRTMRIADSETEGEGSDRRGVDPDQRARAHRSTRLQSQALGQWPSGNGAEQLPPRQARTRPRSYREFEDESGDEDGEPAELQPALRRTRGIKRSYRDDSEDEDAWHEPAGAAIAQGGLRRSRRQAEQCSPEPGGGRSRSTAADALNARPKRERQQIQRYSPSAEELFSRADSLQPEANGISARLRRHLARADRHSPGPPHRADSAADQDAASNGDSDRLRSVDEALPQASIKVRLRRKQLRPEQSSPGPSEPQDSMPRSLAGKETGPSRTRLTSNAASQSPESEEELPSKPESQPPEEPIFEGPIPRRPRQPRPPSRSAREPVQRVER